VREQATLTKQIRRQRVQQVQGAPRDVGEVVANLLLAPVVVHRIEHLELLEEDFFRVDRQQVVANRLGLAWRQTGLNGNLVELP